MDWVFDCLFCVVFGDFEMIGECWVEEVDVVVMIEWFIVFVMENYEVCCVWLLQVLVLFDVLCDMFWCEYSGLFQCFVVSDFVVFGIDVEVLVVMNLVGVFFWLVWVCVYDGGVVGVEEFGGCFVCECL